ncbi:hypothetical protein [Mesorhizobium sp. M0571]|uniref:hypothetical protein n=1 Tax=Mesorhizobium sp. M0571 TaxID=2956960 RepID=UPI0033397874
MVEATFRLLWNRLRRECPFGQTSGASILIPPNDPPHRSYFRKPPNSNTLPFPRRWVLRFDVHELVLAAPFAAHFAPHQFRLNVPEDFLQVTRLIPVLDVTESALNAHKLPCVMGIAELPFATALSSSTSVRHDPK